MKTVKIYEKITDKLIELLESGTVPWNMPWTKTGERPKNAKTDKAYCGNNSMILSLFQMTNNYSCNLWATYKQWKDLGGQVKKGEKSVPCVYFSQVPRSKKGETDSEASEEHYMYMIAKGFNVFNLDQVEGLEDLKEKTLQNSTTFNHPTCKDILNNMPNKPNLTTAGDMAYYRLSTDNVNMPGTDKFHSEPDYWATLFHELIHSTGHSSRLDRFAKAKAKDDYHSNKERYSAEELAAEIGSAYLCGVAGISKETIEQSASYIDNWINVLKDNKTAMGRAIGQAQAAVDYILNNK